MIIDTAKAFQLPDGSFIKLDCLDATDKNVRKACGSNSYMDVVLVTADLQQILICSLNYDNEKDDKKVRLEVYDQEHDEPIYERIVEYQLGEET